LYTLCQEHWLLVKLGGFILFQPRGIAAWNAVGSCIWMLRGYSKDLEGGGRGLFQSTIPEFAQEG
jgi:hypothetical protein